MMNFSFKFIYLKSDIDRFQISESCDISSEKVLEDLNILIKTKKILDQGYSEFQDFLESGDYLYDDLLDDYFTNGVIPKPLAILYFKFKYLYPKDTSKVNGIFDSDDIKAIQNSSEIQESLCKREKTASGEYVQASMFGLGEKIELQSEITAEAREVLEKKAESRAFGIMQIKFEPPRFRVVREALKKKNIYHGNEKPKNWKMGFRSTLKIPESSESQRLTEKYGKFVKKLLAETEVGDYADLVVGAEQKSFILQKLDDEGHFKLVRSYLVSTSKYGYSNEEGSYKTPHSQVLTITKQRGGYEGRPGNVGGEIPPITRLTQVIDFTHLLGGPMVKIQTLDGRIKYKRLQKKFFMYDVSRLNKRSRKEPSTMIGLGTFFVVKHNGKSVDRGLGDHVTNNEGKLGKPDSSGCIRRSLIDSVDRLQFITIGKTKMLVVKDEGSEFKYAHRKPDKIRVEKPLKKPSLLNSFNWGNSPKKRTQRRNPKKKKWNYFDNLDN